MERSTLQSLVSELREWSCAIFILWSHRPLTNELYTICLRYPDNQAIAYCSGKVCHEDDIFITVRPFRALCLSARLDPTNNSCFALLQFGTTPYSLISPARTALTQEVMTRWGNFAAQNTRSPWYKSTKWNTYSSEADVLPLGQNSITRTVNRSPSLTPCTSTDADELRFLPNPLESSALPASGERLLPSLTGSFTAPESFFSSPPLLLH